MVYVSKATMSFICKIRYRFTYIVALEMLTGKLLNAIESDDQS